MRTETNNRIARRRTDTHESFPIVNLDFLISLFSIAFSGRQFRLVGNPELLVVVRTGA